MQYSRQAALEASKERDRIFEHQGLTLETCPDGVVSRLGESEGGTLGGFWFGRDGEAAREKPRALWRRRECVGRGDIPIDVGIRDGHSPTVQRL